MNAVLIARLTLDIPPGAITVLMGPSGSGKTTLIKHITGMLESRPIEGTFRYTKFYSHSGGAWRITNFQATRVSTRNADSDMDQGTPLPDDGTKRRNSH